MGSGDSRRLGVSVYGDWWFRLNGSGSIWKRPLQLHETTQVGDIWSNHGREDDPRYVHDDTGRDGRCRGENHSLRKASRLRACSTQPHSQEDTIQRGEESNTLIRPRGTATILESLDRRHGGETGRNGHLHDRRQGSEWERLRYHRRSGRAGVSRRRLNREAMEISQFEKSMERAEIRPQTDMGCSKQGRHMVGPTSEHSLAISKAEGASYIQSVSTSNGETAESRDTLSGEHDGHQDRVECRADLGRHVDMVIVW
jgi:hypothetical protein